jgi:hypothetical protein
MQAHHITFLYQKIILKIQEKYYNPLRAINLSTCRHVTSPVSIENISENSRNVILTFYNDYGLRLLVMIFSINKNYLSIVLIFDFSKLTEKPTTLHGVIN